MLVQVSLNLDSASGQARHQDDALQHPHHGRQSHRTCEVAQGSQLATVYVTCQHFHSALTASYSVSSALTDEHVLLQPLDISRYVAEPSAIFALTTPQRCCEK